MEKANDDMLMKSRSTSAAVGAGFRLYTGNFRRILRYSWIGALVFALVSGLYRSYFTTEYPRLTVGILATGGDLTAWSADLLQSGLILGIGNLLVLVVNMVLLSYGFSLLHQHQTTGTIPYPTRLFNFNGHICWRTVKCFFCLLLFLLLVIGLISMLAGIAVATLSQTVALAAIGLVGLAAILLTIPVYFIIMKYMLGTNSFWSVFAYGYGRGMSHYGYLLVILLVDLLVSAVAFAVTSLPAIILTAANTQSQLGILNGDPAGMPSYMGILTFCIFSIAAFIEAYILMAFLFPLYYMYGSIEQQEEERTQALQKIQKA